MRTEPKPDDAWWDPEAQEWVHGAKDAAGQLVGEVRYWDKDGNLISTAEHALGKPHGYARRYVKGEITQACVYVDGVIDGVRSFMRPAPELAQLPTSVVAYECVYERGDLIGTRYRDREGREVDQSGTPIRVRPPNIEPTASPFRDGWLYMRRRGEAGEKTLVSRQYYDDGTLKEETDYTTGIERAYYANGGLAREGKRERTGDGRRFLQIGDWRIWDAEGWLRRVERYEGGACVHRAWHRTRAEAKRGVLVREGPVDNGSEVGVWIAGQRIDVGPRISDQELLAHAVTADLLDEEIARSNVSERDPTAIDRSIVAVLARARRAGIARNIALLALDEPRAWCTVDDTGKLVPLAAELGYRDPLVECLHALRWGPPDGDILAQIAGLLFNADRVQAALDVIDAALLLGTDGKWTTARTAYLRASGQGPSIESKLDARARELLAEIRQHPEDDAPRLVFADHIASAFPAHTALIVGQCAGRDDAEILRAFRATLPSWLQDEAPVRGFLEGVHYLEAEHFVRADPDLLDRVMPACRALELQYASPHIAELVTLPWLRRLAELSFHDTYISVVQAQQLARCPHLDDLEHLGLWCTSLDDDELRALCTGPAFPRLQRLDIGNHRDDQSYGVPGLHALGDAPFAKTLRALSMANRWLGDEVVEVFEKLPALVDLDLTNGALTDDGARALLALPNAWTNLALGGSDFSESMTAALVARYGDRVRFTR